jgi:glycosyltransferase involved in cell wall biosynthesis
MNKKKIIILSNDRIFHKKFFYTSNNDLNTILESFKNKEIYLIARKSYKKYEFKLNQFNKSKNIYLKNYTKIKSLFTKDVRYYNILMISVTPFNVFIFFYFKYFLNLKLKGYVYLRSDGYREYKKKFGIIGTIIYHYLYSIVKNNLKIISCSSNFTNTNNYIRVFPSELNSFWKKNIKKPFLEEVRLLYIGRFRIEKGVFSLLNLLKKVRLKYIFYSLGYYKNLRLNKKIYFKKNTTSREILRSYYDKTNIFILPSYTEGYPKVLLESLSRMRPIIIFDDIKHVKKNFYGVFVCKRDPKELENMIEFIIINYKKIQNKMLQNKLPTRKMFQNKLSKIFS